MNYEFGDDAEALPQLRTICPSASWSSVFTTRLVAISGLQVLFIVLLLRTGWTTAFSGATGLLLVDLVAVGRQTGLRQLTAHHWPFIPPHGLV